MARFVVVAGTDTGVGKTFVSVALASALTRSGRRVVAVKPVESGCGEGALGDEDGAHLAAATGQSTPTRALLRFRAPVTPALAADLEGASVDVDALAAAVHALGASADLVLVEGAGGLLSPLSWSADVTHLARSLGASVLLVGADRLGALHHVRSAVQVMRAEGSSPIGIVLSAPAIADASTGTNVDALRRLLAPDPALARRIVRVDRTSVAREAEAAVAPVIDWLSE